MGSGGLARPPLAPARFGAPRERLPDRVVDVPPAPGDSRRPGPMAMSGGSPDIGRASLADLDNPFLDAVSIRQPWASLILAGMKTVETRSWRFGTRGFGPLIVHAGRKPDPVLRDPPPWIRHALAAARLGDGRDLPRGAFLGTVELVACVACDELLGLAEGEAPEYWGPRDWRGGAGCQWREMDLGDWSAGRWAWLLRSPRPFPEPVPGRGRLGLFSAALALGRVGAAGRDDPIPSSTPEVTA